MPTTETITKAVIDALREPAVIAVLREQFKDSIPEKREAEDIDDADLAEFYPDLAKKARKGCGSIDPKLQELLMSSPEVAQKKIREASIWLKQDIKEENIKFLSKYLKSEGLGIAKGTKNIDFLTSLLPHAKDVIAEHKELTMESEFKQMMMTFLGKYADDFTKVTVILCHF